MNALIRSAGIAAALLVATAAAAEPPIQVEGPPQAVVTYRDLNLGTSEGISALRGRVRAAAQRLCLDHRGGGVWERMTRQACFNRAVAGARLDVDRAIAQFGRTDYAGGAITIAVR